MHLRYILLFIIAAIIPCNNAKAQIVNNQSVQQYNNVNNYANSDSIQIKKNVKTMDDYINILKSYENKNSMLQDIDNNMVINAYRDSIRALNNRLDSLISLRSTYSFSKGMDPRMYRLFIPATFYHSSASKRLRLKNTERGVDPVLDEVDDMMMNLYLSRPDLIVNNESRLASVGSIRNKIKKPIRHNVDLVEKVAPMPEEHGVAPMDLVVTRPNFWHFDGDCYLQFLQNFVSKNWYKGGENSYSMVGSASFEFNYNNKSRFKWDNKLEMKLGFQTTNGDTLHTFKTSEDLIRYTSKVGLQATNKWYYTLQMIGTTQFARGYKENDPAVYSDFMAPFNMNLSLGMDYQVDTKDHKLKGNIHLAPIAYNFRYVSDKALAPRFGIDEDKHMKHDIGSEFVCDLKWIILNNFSWQARLYGYTTYKRTEFEWENTLTFNFNRYISTKIFIYPRFDDGTDKGTSSSYWQFKEFASVGFSYEF